MKLTKTVICAAVAGAMAFAASKASATPLYLKSISGVVTVTPDYSALSSADSAKPTSKRFNLKQIMPFASNRVFAATGTIVPAGSKIAWDPYVSFECFFTNSSGFHTNISGFEARIIEIATSFKGNSSGGGIEKDTIVIGLWISGDDANGQFFKISQDYGTGTLTASLNGNTGVGTTTIKSKGGGYGSYLDSDDGVSYSTAVWSGKGIPQWGAMPFSVWWWD